MNNDSIAEKMQKIDNRLQLEQRLRDSMPDIKIPEEKIEDVLFCFWGQPSYEILGWLPFLKFIKEKYNVKLTTCSSLQTASLYNFSAKHIAFKADFIPEFRSGLRLKQIAYYEDYKRLQGLLKIDMSKMVFPSSTFIGRHIFIGDCEWNIKNVLSVFPTNYYSPLDYSDININLPFKTDKPIVLLCNKNYRHVTFNSLDKSFFDSSELIRLKDFLTKHGFFCVYYQFDDIVAERGRDREQLHAENIFGNDDSSYFINPGLKNIDFKTLMGYMHASEFVISASGHVSYLSMLCRKDLYLMLACGHYTDYKSMSSIYQTKFEPFFSVDFMMPYLDSVVDERYKKTT